MGNPRSFRSCSLHMYCTHISNNTVCIKTVLTCIQQHSTKTLPTYIQQHCIKTLLTYIHTTLILYKNIVHIYQTTLEKNTNHIHRTQTLLIHIKSDCTNTMHTYTAKTLHIYYTNTLHMYYTSIPKHPTSPYKHTAHCTAETYPTIIYKHSKYCTNTPNISALIHYTSCTNTMHKHNITA